MGLPTLKIRSDGPSFRVELDGQDISHGVSRVDITFDAESGLPEAKVTFLPIAVEVDATALLKLHAHITAQEEAGPC